MAKLFERKKILFISFILIGFFTFSSLSTAQVNIAVLYSNLSEQYSPNNSQNVLEEITSWELLLMQNKIPYKVIYDDDLESGIEDDFDILILPGIEFISKTEIEELKAFTASGKSIISVGSKLFFPENNYDNYQNLVGLFGLNKIENISDNNISYLHSISPNHLNQFMPDDDCIIQISTANEPLICTDIGNDVRTYGYSILENNFISNNSSIFYGTSGRGKYLWTGFGINDIVGGKSDSEQFQKLILNTIKWMDREPDIYFNLPWTDGKNPSILTLEFNNALEPQLVNVLQNNDFNPNLIVNSMQKISKEVLRKFSDDRIILDISYYISDSLIKSETIEELIAKFELDNEVEVSNILLNKAFVDNKDLKFLENIGIENVLLYSEVNGNPIQNSENLFILPFSKTNINSNSTVRFFHYIPKINCEQNSEDEFLTMINQLDKSKFDFTSLKKVGEWWKIKNKLDAKIIAISENNIEVLVNNKNIEQVNNLHLNVNLNGTIDKRNISVISNNHLLEHHFLASSFTLVVSIDKLVPKSTKKFIISFGEK